MEVQDVQTYGDLLRILQTLTPEQLAQPAQVVKSHPIHEKVLTAFPIICVGTVDKLGLLYVRSSKDNRRHGEEVILFLDGNPHSKNGAIAWQLNGDDFAKGLPGTPIFPPDFSPDQDWTGPAQKLVDETVQELPDGSLGAVLRYRLNSIDKDENVDLV